MLPASQFDYENETPRRRDVWLHSLITGQYGSVTPSVPRYTTSHEDTYLLMSHVARTWSIQRQARLGRLLSTTMHLHESLFQNPFVTIYSFLQDPSVVGKAVWNTVKEFDGNTIRDSQAPVDRVPALPAE